MKIIPTEYNGIKYRSRLEARWAVVMDSLRVRHEYEPEAYDLDGICYTPDFYLTDRQVFLEIKPTAPNNFEETKAKRLSKFTKKPVFIFWGPVGYSLREEGFSFVFRGMAIGPPEFGYQWCICSKCGIADIQHRQSCEWAFTHLRGCPNENKVPHSFDDPILISAMEAGRTKRFWK